MCGNLALDFTFLQSDIWIKWTLDSHLEWKNIAIEAMDKFLLPHLCTLWLSNELDDVLFLFLHNILKSPITSCEPVSLAV